MGSLLFFRWGGRFLILASCSRASPSHGRGRGGRSSSPAWALCPHRTYTPRPLLAVGGGEGEGVKPLGRGDLAHPTHPSHPSLPTKGDLCSTVCTVRTDLHYCTENPVQQSTSLPQGGITRSGPYDWSSVSSQKPNTSGSAREQDGNGHLSTVAVSTSAKPCVTARRFPTPPSHSTVTNYRHEGLRYRHPVSQTDKEKELCGPKSVSFFPEPSILQIQTDRHV